MKRTIILLFGVAGWAFCLGAGIALLVFTPRDPVQQAEVLPRRTTLTDSEGNLINYFSVQNLDVVGGEATIDVKTLTPDVTQNSWDGRSIGFRNHSGTWEFQNYSGNWQDVGNAENLAANITQLNATGDRVVGIRNNDGVWQFQNYSGNWQDVGQSGSSYALRGDGLSSLASANFPTMDGFFGAGSTWTLYGVVSVDQWDRAEAFLTVTDDSYSTTILEFGKDASGYLYLTIASSIGTETYAADTYTSPSQVFTADDQGVPVPIGVMYTGDATVAFQHHHMTEATTALFNPVLAADTTATYTLGDGLDGRLFFLGLSRATIYPATASQETVTPLQSGLSHCQYCRWIYDLRDGRGETVTNRVAAVLQNTTSFNFTRTGGAWELWSNGY